MGAATSRPLVPDVTVGRADGSGEAGTVSGDSFRRIMSALPAGVSVITTVDADDRPKGMTATAVCSVSLEPPMLLVCIDSQSRTLAAIKHRGAFAVNILGADAETLARLFASSRTADFSAVPWRPSASAAGVPVLTSGVAGFAECRVDRVVPAGDHHIVLAVVVGGGAEDTAALSYARRVYHPIRVTPDQVTRASKHMDNEQERA